MQPSWLPSYRPTLHSRIMSANSLLSNNLDDKGHSNIPLQTSWLTFSPAQRTVLVLPPVISINPIACHQPFNSLSEPADQSKQHADPHLALIYSRTPVSYFLIWSATQLVSQTYWLSDWVFSSRFIKNIIDCIISRRLTSSRDRCSNCNYNFIIYCFS